jgi:hypothetical protein
MALNIEELDKKIHQKQMELVELEEFRSLFLKYGDDISGKNGNHRRASTKKQPTRRAARSVSPPNANGLKDAILGLDLTVPVTVDKIVDMLRAKNLNFKRRQVRDSIHVLVKKKKGFRRVKQGVGGQQSLYEKVL